MLSQPPPSGAPPLAVPRGEHGEEVEIPGRERELALSAAKHSFDVRCDWIATKENVFADSASRADKDGWGVFFRHCQERLGLEPEQLAQVTPSLDVPAALEKIRRVYLAKARREAYGDEDGVPRPPRSND